VAREEGVTSFVVPLTKPDVTRQLFETVGFDDECEFYSPGFGAQGGDPSAFDFLRRHYLIIGRSLRRAEDPVKYIETIEQQLAE